MTTFTVEVESDYIYISMGDSRRPTPSYKLNACCTVIVRVSYGYGYTRGSGRVWVEIFGAGRVRLRVALSATGTGRVAEMVDPHTPNAHTNTSTRTPMTASVTMLRASNIVTLNNVIARPLRNRHIQSSRSHYGLRLRQKRKRSCLCY